MFLLVALGRWNNRGTIVSPDRNSFLLCQLGRRGDGFSNQTLNRTENHVFHNLSENQLQKALNSKSESMGVTHDPDHCLASGTIWGTCFFAHKTKKDDTCIP